MPTPIVAGNWKMNTTLPEAIALAHGMREVLQGIDIVESVLCPPFISLSAVKDIINGTSIRVGAQNMHPEEKGAYTGEISSAMLANLCEYVIIGHSERRQYSWETDELINRKIKAAIATGLRPILCVGEGLDEREAGWADSVVTAQLHGALSRITSIKTLAIAYEPIWAIGTGISANGETAEAMMKIIRNALNELYGMTDASDVPLLYGGSVTPDNISEFASQPNIDGALVGGASLDAQRFAEIAQAMGNSQ